MPITNEDIISSLVAYYQRTGVDMTALLGDPTWQSMKVYDKIEAIKQHAQAIHNGSSSTWNHDDKKRIVTDAVMNSWPVIPAIATLALHGPIMKVLPGVHGKTLLGVGLGGVAIGLGVGAMQAYIQAKQARDYRQAVRTNLGHVINNPSTTNAVGVLATDNIRRNQFSTKDAILQRVRSELEKNFHPGEWIVNNYDKHLTENNNVALKEQAFLAAQANFQNGPN